MPIYVHLIHESDTWLRQRLDSLYTQNELILANQEAIMSTVKELVADVAAIRGKADSIGKLISGLREQIAGLIAGNLPPDQAFADAEAAKTELSAAVDNPGGPTSTTATPAPSASATTSAPTSSGT